MYPEIQKESALRKENAHVRRKTESERHLPGTRLAARGQRRRRSPAEAVPALIRSIRQNFCQDLSYEDLEQELILHFLEQTACYDPKKNPSFAGYITPRLRWQRMNLIRKEMTREDHEELTLEDQPKALPLTTTARRRPRSKKSPASPVSQKSRSPSFFFGCRG